MRKRGEKLGTRLMKNLPNSMRKRGGKLIIYYFAEDEKPPKPSLDNGKENQIMIEDRGKRLDQKFE